jgi:hypothetical protein
VKIVLEMNHEEALVLLEEINAHIFDDGDSEEVYDAITAIQKRLKGAIKHPQSDIEPEGNGGLDAKTMSEVPKSTPAIG